MPTFKNEFLNRLPKFECVRKDLLRAHTYFVAAAAAEHQSECGKKKNHFNEMVKWIKHINKSFAVCYDRLKHIISHLFALMYRFFSMNEFRIFFKKSNHLIMVICENITQCIFCSWKLCFSNNMNYV